MNKEYREHKQFTMAKTGALPEDIHECMVGMTTGFVMIPNDLCQYIMKRSGMTAFGIYHLIFSCKNNDADSCYPSISKIGEMAGVSRTTVKNNIQKLVDDGFLIIKSGGIVKGKHEANHYYFPYRTDIYTDEEYEDIFNINRRAQLPKKIEDTPQTLSEAHTEVIEPEVSNCVPEVVEPVLEVNNKAEEAIQVTPREFLLNCGCTEEEIEKELAEVKKEVGVPSIDMGSVGIEVSEEEVAEVNNIIEEEVVVKEVVTVEPCDWYYEWKMTLGGSERAEVNVAENKCSMTEEDKRRIQSDIKLYGFVA